MMYDFLTNNREELITRCKVKVALRPQRKASGLQLQTGIPLFLEQLTRTLEAEQLGHGALSRRISGTAGGVAEAPLSEMGVAAAAHGKDLLALGFTVDQVVHDYGDLCQAITDLAVERDAPFTVDEFRTLNRCLDNAIAQSVTEFSVHRDAQIERTRSAETNERIGVLVHELRNALNTASLAFTALEIGSLPVTGSTGGVLKRSLAALGVLITQSLEEVRAQMAMQHEEVSSLALFIKDARSSAELDARARQCELVVAPVDPALGILVNQDLMQAALANLLTNAFKFTRPHSKIMLTAHAAGTAIFIDVEDHCGGLPPGKADMIFTPFFQRNEDRSGVGLGLSIARRAVEADGGKLTVRDVPGSGCVFTICLPRHTVH